MTPDDLDAFFTIEALAALRSRPAYADAADGLARGSLCELAQMDAAGRWMVRDLGRSSIYLAMVFLNGTPAGVSAFSLASAARAQRFASRGRVMAFLRHAQEVGELIVPPGSGPWTQRRLCLGQRFVDRFRGGNLNYARMVALVVPELAGFVDRLHDDNFLRHYVTGVILASQAASAASSAASSASRHGEKLFLERDCGMSILFRLMASQDRPRARLLESARFSRAGMSREFGVSRAHINRLLADAAAVGLLSFPASDTVRFEPELSDDVDRMITDTLQITRVALLYADTAVLTPM
jgi:hypothetical protein